MNPDLSDERLRDVAQFSASKWAADMAREVLRLRDCAARFVCQLCGHSLSSHLHEEEVDPGTLAWCWCEEERCPCQWAMPDEEVTP